MSPRATASLDVGLLPICGHGVGIIGVIEAIGGGVGNGHILGSFALDALPIRPFGFGGWFVHPKLFSFIRRPSLAQV